MSKKITEDGFVNRFYKRYPYAKIQVLEYTAISKPAKIKCLKCGKILNRKIARQFLNGFDCCGAHVENRLEKLERLYQENKDFIIVRQIDKDNVIVKHLLCGNEYKRNLAACVDNPYSCKYCGTHKNTNMMSIEEAQEQLNEKLYGEVQILDYNGQLEKNHYRCLKCGLIFTKQHTSLLQSKGCPKCDKIKSCGEKILAKKLIENNIIFKEQVSVHELPLQHFDFGIYDTDDNLLYFIEVQGEQHYKVVPSWGGQDGFARRQKLDNKKRKYCQEHNIPLYELIYGKNKKFLNLDILPF